MKDYIKETLDLPETKYLLLGTLCLIILSFFYVTPSNGDYEFLDARTRANKRTGEVEHYHNGQYGHPAGWTKR